MPDPTGLRRQTVVLIPTAVPCRTRRKGERMALASPNRSEPMSEARIIKKYPNRRLYDTDTSTYITLHEVRKLVMENETVVVRDAKTGEDALLAIRDQRFDLVLLDLNMPIMDGFGFLDAFNKLEYPNKEKAKIIVLTSSQNSSDMERARKFGVTRYMTKPLNLMQRRAGVVLHLAESHAHEHEHEALEHEHAHRHDDGHHDHVHDPTPAGAHSHVHRHEPMRHAHAHVPDAHHLHRH